MEQFWLPNFESQPQVSQLHGPKEKEVKHPSQENGWNWWTYSVGDYDRNRTIVSSRNASILRCFDVSRRKATVKRLGDMVGGPKGILAAACELGHTAKGWQKRLVEKTRSRTVKATVKLLTKSIVYFYLFISLKMNL